MSMDAVLVRTARSLFFVFSDDSARRFAKSALVIMIYKAIDYQ